MKESTNPCAKKQLTPIFPLKLNGFLLKTGGNFPYKKNLSWTLKRGNYFHQIAFSNMGFSWIVCFCWIFLLCYSTEAVVTVDVHAAKDLIRSGHRYLDVRTTEEFKKGHVENALNVPYLFITPQGRVENPEFMEQVLKVCNKDDHLIVGCQSGVRSLSASLDLLNAEFKHVNNMGGGYLAWVENSFAVKIPEEIFPVQNYSQTPIKEDSMKTQKSIEAVVTVDVHAAKDLIRSGHRYLDVRTTEEFKKGHVENALNVPYLFITPQGRVKNPEFMEQVLNVCNKDEHLIVGCQSGVRSLSASLDLLNARHMKKKVEERRK
ncbi:uncharacterized protein LOC143854184 isoform X2 [Tasmannia lanceolata]|uniref:uncharacterized protein LOC143854184 isoform X2 n=1 Tax=Tasmannia lanceolata TaxID=3420 RepID=UPI004062E9C2